MPFSPEKRRLYDAARLVRPSGQPKVGRKAYNVAYPNRAGKRLPKVNQWLIAAPFVGCDGEGSGGERVRNFFYADDAGETIITDPWRQYYKLFRIGENYLLDQTRPLTTEACLKFITEQPADQIMVGYFFDYDVTMILRDIYQDDMASIVKSGFANHTIWRGYSIRYIPKHSLKVGRVNPNGYTISNSYRTIHDVGRFFQCPFVKALKQWAIVDDETLKIIQVGKDARGSDMRENDEARQLTPTDIEYNRLEVLYLEKLMTDFRQSCIEADCVPSDWTGPGQIAATLMKRNQVPKRKSLHIPASHHNAWSGAYYGGRFEATSIGRRIGEIHEYDIRSAYPDAMRSLPCLKCNPIYQTSEKLPVDNHDWSVAEIEFEHKDAMPLCAFPIRTREGSLLFPRKGKGWYCGPEIFAAIRAGVRVKLIGPCYTVKQTCDCRPFDWIHELYLYRRSIGSGTKGIALKLGLNSIYGKMVQRIGEAPFFNPIYASLITSYVRARLFEACQHNPASVLMLATDAVYSTAPLPLPIGDDLGQWEHQTFDRIFIAKPGIYVAGDNKEKTRGIGASKFHEAFPAIEKRFMTALDNKFRGPGGEFTIPGYEFDVTLFIGVRLALQRRFDLRGCWVQQFYNLNLDWRNKRSKGSIIQGRGDGMYMHTQPKGGSLELRSKLYSDPDYKGSRTRDISELDAQPDFIAITPMENGDEI